jgi:hypothetical protein
MFRKNENTEYSTYLKTIHDTNAATVLDWSILSAICIVSITQQAWDESEMVVTKNYQDSNMSENWSYIPIFCFLKNPNSLKSN